MRPLLPAQPLEQVEDFRLHRNVERRGRLVEQQQFWLKHQGARDRHALALAAGELMRKAEAETPVEPDGLHHLLDARASWLPRPWIASGSLSVASIVWRGCSEP